MTQHKPEVGDIYLSGNDLYILVQIREQYSYCMLYYDGCFRFDTPPRDTIENAMFDSEEDTFVMNLGRGFWKPIEEALTNEREN